MAPFNFFRSHVRDDPEANGIVFQSPGSALCTLTSEKVTSSAFASLNGLSVSRIDSAPVALDVPPPVLLVATGFVVGSPGVLLSEHAKAAAAIAAAAAAANDFDERVMWLMAP